MHKLILFSLTVFGYGTSEIVCPKYIKCTSSLKSCPLGLHYRTNVRVGGCCPGCVNLKDENQFCNTSTECLQSLTCSPEKLCKKDPHQACEYFKRFDSLWNQNKYWMPSCLPDGTYAPKQCKGEKMFGKCFCFDEKGNRIFGEEEWFKAGNMTCACSRLVTKIKKSDNNKDVTIHCDSMGNFEPLQCDQEVCWCAHPKTGFPYSLMVPSKMIASLPCYNKNRVGEQYFKKCDSERRMQENAKNLLKNHGTTKIALNMPNCNFDGSYNRVQMIKEKSKCVYINNLHLTEPVPFGNADCNCAYDRHVHQLKNILFFFDCQPNGNYFKVQTLDRKKYCIDSDGIIFSDNINHCSTRN